MPITIEMNDGRMIFPDMRDIAALLPVAAEPYLEEYGRFFGFSRASARNICDLGADPFKGRDLSADQMLVKDVILGWSKYYNPGRKPLPIIII